MKLDESKIIESYLNGSSMTAIARELNTYATTIKRILEKNKIELRHDNKKAGILCVRNGEKLIEWAKAQGRPVTKSELAKLVGTLRLSPSYFEKYPELGQYMATREQEELKIYYDKLYDWLKENNIPYKPNDRTKLGVSIDALLLGDYSGIALQIITKPKYKSAAEHNERMTEKMRRAVDMGIKLIFLNEKQFNNMANIKTALEFAKINKE